MSLALHLKAVGASLLVLSLAHIFFPRHFGWPAELRGLSTLARQVFWVHYFFIALILFMFGALSLLMTDHLLGGGALGRAVLGGFAVFWLARLFVQLFVYDKSLWRGHRLHTAMHVLFTCAWCYFAAVYAFAFWS